MSDILNPKSALHCHRQKIAEDRASARRTGIIGMWLMSALLVAFTIFCIVLQLNKPLSLGAFLQMYLLIAVMLACLFYLMGYSEYQRGKQPITEQEVEQRRQKERAELFRQAQGELPMYYRPWRILVERIIGILFVATGIVCLVFAIRGLQKPEALLIVYGLGLLLPGGLLLWLAFYAKPREAKQVSTWSSRLLRHRMARGEMTEGNTIEEDSLN